MRPVGSKYLLEEPLGRGATGTVWRARVRDEEARTLPGDPATASRFGTGQYGTGQYGTGQYGTGQYGTGESGAAQSASTILFGAFPSGGVQVGPGPYVAGPPPADPTLIVPSAGPDHAATVADAALADPAAAARLAAERTAADIAAGRLVAIKVLKEELANDPDIVMRFLRERSVLLRLAHPNIVRVRDLVVEGELLALVMDLVDGPDLHRYLTDHGPLSPVAAALLMAQIADALATSHADGIVHRDLKPANVMLATVRGADGSEQMLPLLTDFGIARLADSPGITRTHEFVGTPAYVAPESAEGREQTAAVDVYGAGIMLYELVSGQPPFHGDGPLQILHAHLTQEPRRPVTVPEPLWTVIERCLSKDPAQRPTAVTLATALRTVAAGIGVHASPAAIDAAYAVGALLAPVAGPHDPTVPNGLNADPAAATVLAASVFGAAEATELLPQGAADPTRLLPPAQQGFAQQPTRLQAAQLPPTQLQPHFEQQQYQQPPYQQPEPEQPAGPHPWESQLRAARNRSEQTQYGYAVEEQPQSRPQVAPPPYQRDPQYRGEPQYRGDRYGAEQYPGEQYPGGRGYEPDGYGSEQPYEPEPPRGRRPAPGARPAPEPVREAPPREREPERRREPEPEPRRERAPRAPRRRMRIPGGGCLRSLLILAVIAAVVWWFTPLQHWIHNGEGWWHQVVNWWDRMTGTADKIKNEVPKIPKVPTGLPTDQGN